MIATVFCQRSISSIQHLESHPTSEDSSTSKQATMAVGISHKAHYDEESTVSKEKSLGQSKAQSFESTPTSFPAVVAASPTSVIIGRKEPSTKRVHFSIEEYSQQQQSSYEVCDDGDCVMMDPIENSSSMQSSTNDDVAVDIDCNRLELTYEERIQMWWQAREYNSFKRKAKHIAKIYQTLGPLDEEQCDYVTRFRNAIDVCTNSSSHMDSVPLLSNTPTRGLEAYIFPQYHSERRKKVIKSVLRAQRKLPTTIDVDGRARLLNATSKHLTRPMRRLARLLAIGDARVAASLDLNDDDRMMLDEPTASD